MIKIESDIKEKFKSIFPYAPKELRPVMEKKNLEDYKYILPRFHTGHLPFNFKMNTRGGWITPDGTWYLPSLTASVDDVLRPRLKNQEKFNYKLRSQAFQEGWIRVDWQQPNFSMTFTTNEVAVKKLIITLDNKTEIDLKTFLAIQAIAAVYSLATPKNLVFELRLITRYDNNKIFYKSKTSRGIEFFILDLLSQRK